MVEFKRKRRRKNFTEKTGYSPRLLDPGYSGELGDDELKIIKKELANRSRLRKRWGFAEGERITSKKIQDKAMNGVEDGDGSNKKRKSKKEG